jgi:hypothetical protein
MNLKVYGMYLVGQVVRFRPRFEPRICRIKSTSAAYATVTFNTIYVMFH